MCLCAVKLLINTVRLSGETGSALSPLHERPVGAKTTPCVPGHRTCRNTHSEAGASPPLRGAESHEPNMSPVVHDVR